MTTALDGKTYNLTYYNLDIVLSVGYRDKSARATEFRRWATSVLKQYLIKGYAINTKRCMEHSDIISNLSNKVMELSNSVSDVKSENKIINKKIKTIMTYFNDPSLYKHFLILKGEKLESDIAYQKIYTMAKHSIYIIDDYVDMVTLELLRSALPGIEIVIITDNISLNKLTLSNMEKFKKETNYKVFVVRNKNEFHSRYIVIDYNYKNYKLYLCSGSSKDGGNRINTIVEIEEKELYRPSIDKVLLNEELVFN